MNARYEKYGLPEDHVIEECSELIKAIIKCRRFGNKSRHPRKKVMNYKLVLDEMKDVEKTIRRLRKQMRKKGYK